MAGITLNLANNPKAPSPTEIQNVTFFGRLSFIFSSNLDISQIIAFRDRNSMSSSSIIPCDSLKIVIEKIDKLSNIIEFMH
jgi:hypothetical protein